MKKDQLKQIIKEELNKTLNMKKEALARRGKVKDTEMVMKMLDKDILNTIKETLGTDFAKKMKPDVLRQISLEWLVSTISGGYVDDTLPEDMLDNDIVGDLLSKIDPSWEDLYGSVHKSFYEPR